MRCVDYNTVYELIRDEGPMTVRDVCAKLPEMDQQIILGAICKLSGSKIRKEGRDSGGRTIWRATA